MQPRVWVKIAEMLALGEMPPEDAEQPTPDQQRQLRNWLQHYLHAEALAGNGDPGPVLLCRMNHAEFTYTIRDLTGIDLDPARRFPSEGAGGEGFTNAGTALVMSPGLMTKYLRAGKQIASHAVLLPDGFRFSPSPTRRDWTDEIIAEIREIYGEFAKTIVLGVGTEVGNVNVHENTQIGLTGRLPLEEYFSLTLALAQQDAIGSGATTVDDAAREHGLNARYLRTLWSSLNSTEPSLLLDRLRRH